MITTTKSIFRGKCISASFLIAKILFLGNYRNKKNVKFISVYIKVKIAETSMYDLMSYMRYYIVIAIRELLIIFWPLNDLKWNVINYEVLDLIILYNFDTKFDFIRDHMKSYDFFCVRLFIGAGHTNTITHHSHHWKNIFRDMWDQHPRSEMPPF